jgi:hypothetical protein
MVTGLTIVVVLLVWFFPTSTDFHARNPFWNGLDDFRRDFQVESLESLPRNPEGSALLVIPDTAFAEGDLADLAGYLERGGVLMLADDYGHGNTVLEALGISTRFDGAPLVDPLFNYGTAHFPLAADLAPSALTVGVSALALNYGTALVGPGMTVLASSSPFSYLDDNNDGTRDNDERGGPFPVAGHLKVGKGHLVLLADPSIFINTMLAAKDNRRLVANLINSAGPDPLVLLDQAHLAPSRLDSAKAMVGSTQRRLARPLPLATLVVITTVTLLAPLWWRKGGRFEPG